jgi:hypothetical protein
MELPARHQNDINKQVSDLGPLVLVPSFHPKNVHVSDTHCAANSELQRVR